MPVEVIVRQQPYNQDCFLYGGIKWARTIDLHDVKAKKVCFMVSSCAFHPLKTMALSFLILPCDKG